MPLRMDCSTGVILDEAFSMGTDPVVRVIFSLVEFVLFVELLTIGCEMVVVKEDTIRIRD